MDFMGYVRPDGKAGSRNYVAVIPSVVCANEVVDAIVSQTLNTRGCSTIRAAASFLRIWSG